MRRILLFVLCLCFSGSAEERFISHFVSKYKIEKTIRPVDSLLYIPCIMNLTDDYSFEKRDIQQKRTTLFKHLSRQRLYFSYHYAIDTVNHTLLFCPRGDMDFIERRKPRKIAVYRINPEICSNFFIGKMNPLIRYAKETAPDYLFEIANIVGINYDVYWAIKGGRLFAIQISHVDFSLQEYSADDFLSVVASDDVFSGALRLSL